MMNEETNQPETNESRDNPATDPIECRGVSYSKPLSSWYKWMLIFFAGLPLSFLMGPVFFVPIVAFLVFLLALFIKAVSFSKGKISGQKGFRRPSIVAPILLGSATIISLLGLMAAINNIFYYDYFSSASTLVESLRIYKSEHGCFPDIQHWCDLLKEDPEASTALYNEGDYRFAMNRFLSEVEGEIPGDMVVLFETKSGWNLSGGPELAQSAWGKDYVRVVTADLDSRLVRIADVSYLRWRLDDSENIPQTDMKSYAVTAAGIGLAALSLLIVLRKQVRRWLPLVFFTGMLAMGAGLLFGFISEEPLYRVIQNQHLGWLFGGAAGLLAGVCFVPVLGRVAEKFQPEVSLIGWGTMIGAIVGIVCSCVVHGFLMIAYRETSLVNMAVGVAFGAWAGTMLGWITAWLMGRGRRKTVIVEDAVAGAEVK